MIKAAHRYFANSGIGGDARPATHLYKAAKCYIGGGEGGWVVTIRAKTSLARSVKAGVQPRCLKASFVSHIRALKVSFSIFYSMRRYMVLLNVVHSTTHTVQTSA